MSDVCAGWFYVHEIISFNLRIKNSVQTSLISTQKSVNKRKYSLHLEHVLCDSLPLTWHVELCGGILYCGWQRFCGCYKHLLLYCFFQIISSMMLMLTTFLYRYDALGRSHMGLYLAMKEHWTVIQLDMFVLSCVWLPLYWHHFSFYVYKIRIKLQSLLEDSRNLWYHLAMWKSLDCCLLGIRLPFTMDRTASLHQH